MTWETRVHVERPIWKDGVDVHIYERTDEKIYVHVFTVTRKEYGRHDLISEPSSLPMTDELAQQLMDGLWRVGVRPRNGESSMAHVDAMKYHLEDMRRLVFNVQIAAVDTSKEK